MREEKMYRNHKTGILGIVITIILLILIVAFSNGENNASFFENVASKLVMPVQNGLTYLKNKISGNDTFFTDINKIKEDDGILVNLASDEMKKLFDWKRISKEITIITPDFRTYKNNKLKTIVIYTKMCRGEMTRYILKNRIENIEEIKLFEWEGFKWNQELSKGNNWLFTV